MALCSSYLTARLTQQPTPSPSPACAFRGQARAQAGPPPANRVGATPAPRPSPLVSCDAAAAGLSFSYGGRDDGAYFSDEDLSSVDARPDTEGPSSWLDSNYVSLSVTCYRLMQQKSQEALQRHFQTQKRALSQRQASRRGAFRANAAAASSTLLRDAAKAKASQGAHHACCAPSRDHTFVCGEDEAVAWAVAPAAVHSGDHFIGTP